MIDLEIYHQLHDLIYGATQIKANQADIKSSKSNKARSVTKSDQTPSNTAIKQTQKLKRPISSEKNALKKERDKLDSKYSRFARSFTKPKKDAIDTVIPLPKRFCCNKDF